MIRRGPGRPNGDTRAPASGAARPVLPDLYGSPMSQRMVTVVAVLALLGLVGTLLIYLVPLG